MNIKDLFWAIPDIKNIIENTENIVYEGNLMHYWDLVWDASNQNGPFHNAPHGIYVLLEVYDAIKYYQTHDTLEFGTRNDLFTLRKARNGVVAAILHDINHSCSMATDGENIQNAMDTFILRGEKMDLTYPHEYEIMDNIDATEFPYTKKPQEYSPMQKILQDADSSYNFANEELWGTWQERVWNLSKEKGWSTEETREKHKHYIENLSFQTEWAQNKFNHLLQKRLQEVSSL